MAKREFKANRNRYRAETYVEDITEGRSVYTTDKPTRKKAFLAGIAQEHNARVISGYGNVKVATSIYKPSKRYRRK